MVVGGGGGGGVGNLRKSEKVKKGPFKSVSCCCFPFRCSDRNKDRPRKYSKKKQQKNKAIILAKLMHYRIIVVENTRVKLPTRLSKLCLSVLNDDNTVFNSANISTS